MRLRLPAREEGPPGARRGGEPGSGELDPGEPEQPREAVACLVDEGALVGGALRALPIGHSAGRQGVSTRRQCFPVTAQVPNAPAVHEPVTPRRLAGSPRAMRRQRGQAQRRQDGWARHGPHVCNTRSLGLPQRSATDAAGARSARTSQPQPPRTPVWRTLGPVANVAPDRPKFSRLPRRTYSLAPPAGARRRRAPMSAPAMGPVLASARGGPVAGPKGLARGSRLRHAQPLAGGPQPRRHTCESVSSVRGVARGAWESSSPLAAGPQRRSSARAVTTRASSAAAPGAAVPAPQAATVAVYTPQVRQLVGRVPWGMGGPRFSQRALSAELEVPTSEATTVGCVARVPGHQAGM